MLGNDDEINRKVSVDIIKTLPIKLVGLIKQVRECRPPKLKEDVQALQYLLPSVEELTLEPPVTNHPSHKELQHLVTVLYQSDTLPLSESHTLV